MQSAWSRMHTREWLSNNDNPYKIKWGTLRMDLHHLESHKMKERQYYKPLINMWRYMHVAFPSARCMGGVRNNHWK